MKQIRIRIRLLALLMIIMLGGAAAYGVYSVSSYGSRWFSNARNTRYQAARRTVIAGDIIDRNGVLLASTNADGDRIYHQNAETRCAVVHLLGDPNGNTANGVDSFQANYLLGFETGLGERIGLQPGMNRVEYRCIGASGVVGSAALYVVME